MPQTKILLGIDEAGYGPNLGPLTIAASVWKCENYVGEEDFSERLAGLFRPIAWKTGCSHVPLGDSKKLYSPGNGLQSLEAGLFGVASHLLPLPAEMGNLLKTFAHSTTIGRSMDLSCPWYESLKEQSAPIAIANEELERLALLTKEFLGSQGIELLACDLLLVSAAAFNQQLEQLCSKGQVLSRLTISLAADILTRHREDEVEVFCDRQGGRKDYVPVLLDAMPEEWFVQTERSNTRSSYSRTNGPSCNFHFSVGGDSFPATGLASMLAKYMRERVMGCFNEYWLRHIKDLKPTAGYPVDAKRFRVAIEEKAKALGLSTDQWWRLK